MRLVFLISIFSEFLARMALYFRTEGVYAKGLSVLFPKLDWQKLGVDPSTVDNVTLALQMQGWKAFANQGPSL